MKSNRQTAGFSLVEVMCAILILGIGLVGLTQGISAGLRSSKEAEIASTAALLAAGQMETLRAEGIIIAGESEGDCGPVLPNYAWKQSVTREPIDGLFQVVVVVENVQTGTTLYELKTLLFDPPAPGTGTSRSPDPASRKKDGARR